MSALLTDLSGKITFINRLFAYCKGGNLNGSAAKEGKSGFIHKLVKS